MTDAIIVAAIGTAGSIVGACIAARSAVDKKTREDDIKDAQREQRQQDQLSPTKDRWIRRFFDSGGI